MKVMRVWHIRGRRRATAAVSVIVVATGLLAGTAAAAPIANACGGVIVPGEVTTQHPTYVVQRGDHLYQIVRDLVAARAAAPPDNPWVAREVRTLITLNPRAIQRGGNLIRPGAVLNLPQELAYCTKTGTPTP